MVVSALLITQGEMTTGVYAAISVIIQTALAPVRSIAAIIETIQNSRLSFNTAAELYQDNNSKNEQTLQDDISSKKNSSVDNPILEVKNVSFRYSIYSDTIFDNANLSIRSRSNKPLAVRLDGGTGGGKSTLLNLLLGMQKCNSGSITIYGHDIAKLSTKDRNQLIQYIDRYPIIQAGSVAMNARLGSGASHKDYEKTIYVEEALHRLVELHYRIGLIDEAEKYAILLGYNYQSSKWYEASYKILNKDYKIKNINKDDRETILKKFKNLFK